MTDVIDCRTMLQGEAREDRSIARDSFDRCARFAGLKKQLGRLIRARSKAYDAEVSEAAMREFIAGTLPPIRKPRAVRHGRTAKCRGAFSRA